MRDEIKDFVTFNFPDIKIEQIIQLSDNEYSIVFSGFLGVQNSSLRACIKRSVKLFLEYMFNIIVRVEHVYEVSK